MSNEHTATDGFLPTNQLESDRAFAQRWLDERAGDPTTSRAQVVADALASRMLRLLGCEDGPMRELQQAWLDSPICGKIPDGCGEWLQRLVNAVTAIVDPGEKLRGTDEYNRRGSIANYRQEHAIALSNIRACENARHAVDASDTTDGARGWFEREAQRWQGRADELVALAFQEHGVELGRHDQALVRPLAAVDIAGDDRKDG